MVPFRASKELFRILCSHRVRSGKCMVKQRWLLDLLRTMFGHVDHARGPPTGLIESLRSPLFLKPLLETAIKCSAQVNVKRRIGSFVEFGELCTPSSHSG